LQAPPKSKASFALLGAPVTVAPNPWLVGQRKSLRHHALAEKFFSRQQGDLMIVTGQKEQVQGCWLNLHIEA
jgi:hypothetical protein